MCPEHREESMYNSDYRRMRGWLSEFCKLNRSNPWTQSADTTPSGAHVHRSHAGCEIDAHQSVSHASRGGGPQTRLSRPPSDQVDTAKRQANALCPCLIASGPSGPRRPAAGPLPAVPAACGRGSSRRYSCVPAWLPAAPLMEGPAQSRRGG
jgi:hypothetical protein